LVYPGHTGFALDVERFTGMGQIAVAQLSQDHATRSDSFTVRRYSLNTA